MEFSILEHLGSLIGAMTGSSSAGIYASSIENGLIFLSIGLILIIAEGLLGAKGIMAILGALLSFIGLKILIDVHTSGLELALHPAITAILYGVLFLVVTLGAWLALRLAKAKDSTGTEELLQSTGTIQKWHHTTGVVHVTGEDWQAITETHTNFKKGDKVRIIKINGLVLTIAPTE